MNVMSHIFLAQVAAFLAAGALVVLLAWRPLFRLLREASA